jgi:hypothetical protein
VEDLRSSPTSLPEKETRVGSIGDAVFIAVMGATGAGKSNFIQKASGNMDIRIGHVLESGQFPDWLLSGDTSHMTIFCRNPAGAIHRILPQSDPIRSD